MNKKTFLLLATFSVLLTFGCSNNNGTVNKETVNTEAAPDVKPKTDSLVVSPGNASKGIGRFKDVQLSHPIDAAMASKGQSIFDAKCMACHKTDDEKLVGPGWKGVTDRHSPEWLMNFITNTQVMLDKDLTAQQELAVCVVRMPNQDLTDEQARQILEFMRQNDGKK